jgi:putative SOS response-associated peptidase YedK
MCGRYSLSSDLDRLLPRLQGPLPPGLVQHYAPRAQVRPGEPLLLQRWEHGGPQVALALWGLVPGWVKDPLAPGPDGRRRSRPINARSETVAERAFFRGAWRHRRALLPADGFYEWQERRDPASGRSWKQPWLFRRRDRAPFWLGGLWERWIGADGGELETAVILTTAPNELMARVHDRMPVVIPDGLEQAWLEPDDGPSLRALQPLMEAWEPAAWEAVKLQPQPRPSSSPSGAPIADGMPAGVADQRRAGPRRRPARPRALPDRALQLALPGMTDAAVGSPLPPAAEALDGGGGPDATG